MKNLIKITLLIFLSQSCNSDKKPPGGDVGSSNTDLAKSPTDQPVTGQSQNDSTAQSSGNSSSSQKADDSTSGSRNGSSFDGSAKNPAQENAGHNNHSGN